MVCVELHPPAKTPDPLAVGDLAGAVADGLSTTSDAVGGRHAGA